jgi:hypothetical protein
LVTANPFSSPMLILGLVFTCLGTLYRHDSVPISIQSSPLSPQYTHAGVCGGCGKKFGPGFYSSNPGLLIVQTERGYMHYNCATQAKKRVWRRAKQISFPKFRPATQPIATPGSRRGHVNFISVGILCLSFLGILVMSYPSIPYASTVVQTSASFLTETSFVTTTAAYHSNVLSSMTSTACSFGRNNEGCKTLTSITTSTSTGTFTSTQNQGQYVQTIIMSLTKSMSVSRAPYAALGMSTLNWWFVMGIISLVAVAAAVLVRRF